MFLYRVWRERRSDSRAEGKHINKSSAVWASVQQPAAAGQAISLQIKLRGRFLRGLDFVTQAGRAGPGPPLDYVELQMKVK